MTRVVILVMTIGLGLLASALPGDDAAEAAKRRLRNVAKTDTVLQAGDGSVDANGARISGEPFAFANVGRMARLTEVTITATIHDGDTGPGEGDENELTLVLDGIDTGIKLNGFLNNVAPQLTISGAPANAEKILAALKKDGKLEATIHDADPAVPNALSVPAYDYTFTAILTIKGKQRT